MITNNCSPQKVIIMNKDCEESGFLKDTAFLTFKIMHKGPCVMDYELTLHISLIILLNPKRTAGYYSPILPDDR